MYPTDDYRSLIPSLAKRRRRGAQVGCARTMATRRDEPGLGGKQYGEHDLRWHLPVNLDPAARSAAHLGAGLPMP